MAAEQLFSIDDLFFSTTDPKGVIRSGNRVFERVAGYTEQELLGRPHNVVRHPDMPRAVFQLLWDEIGAGRPLAAYVKNLAKDGSSYWVMACLVPVEDGYLSVRLKPTSDVRDVVEGLYGEMRALELSIEGGDGKARKRAIEASTALLGERLGDLGYPDYRTFMQAALAGEMLARERARSRAPVEQLSGDERLEAVAANVQETLEFLDGLFSNLTGYVDLNRSLAEKSGFIGDLAASIRLYSFNALIAAMRFGGKGAALGAVADIMGSLAVKINAILHGLTESIGETVGLLDGLVFDISLCKLQAEMTVEFARELLREGERSDPKHEARVQADITMLTRSVHREVDGLLESLAQLEGRLHEIWSGSDALAAQLDVLRAVQMNGRIEAAALDGADHVAALFARIREHLDEATRRTDDVVALSRTAVRGTRADAAVRDRLDRLDDLAELIAA